MCEEGVDEIPNSCQVIKWQIWSVLSFSGVNPAQFCGYKEDPKQKVGCAHVHFQDGHGGEIRFDDQYLLIYGAALLDRIRHNRHLGLHTQRARALPGRSWQKRVCEMRLRGLPPACFSDGRGKKDFKKKKVAHPTGPDPGCSLEGLITCGDA